MQGSDSSGALLADDVPAPPASYNEYVQRRLSESIRKAYVRGFNRGCRRQVLALCGGAILGCLCGFYLAVGSQCAPPYGAHIPAAELTDGYPAAVSSPSLAP